MKRGIDLSWKIKKLQNVSARTQEQGNPFQEQGNLWAGLG